MLLSIVRFMANGWVDSLYVEPDFHFKYYGFEWVQAFDSTGMYLLFGGMILGTIGIMTGFMYRFSATLFFLAFTYIDLIDKSTYLNHYYFVSIVAFLMIFLPANAKFSIDSRIWPSIKKEWIPQWMTGAIKLQLGIVYFYAGVAKLNPDWLIHAQPLMTWLPTHADVPLIGWIFKYKATAYLMSWAGAAYDLFVPFFLLIPSTRIFRSNN